MTRSALWMLSVAFAVLMSPALISSHAQVAGPDQGELDAVLKGLEDRAAWLQAVHVRAVAEATYSKSYREWRRADTRARREEFRALVMAESGPEAAARVSLEVAELGEAEARLVDFSWDRWHNRWRVEVVALTNNGQPNGWPLSGALAENRGLPPGLFYRSCFCDGEKVYSYDRSTQEGFVKRFESERDIGASEHYPDLRNAVLAVDPAHLRGLRDGTYKALSLRWREDEEWRRCAEVVLVRQGREASYLLTLLICPDLGYAVVERRSATFGLPTGPPGTPGRPIAATAVVCRDFVPAAGPIWYPTVVQWDWFDYERGKGADAWQSTRMYRIMEVEAGPQVEIRPPFPFPFDTHVTDRSEGAARPPEPPPSLGGPVPGPWQPGDVILQEMRALLEKLPG